MTTTTAVETIPNTWDDARDIPFFRLTARLFTPAFSFGAGVLLASYDDAAVASAGHAGAERGTGTTAAKVDTLSRPERDLVPVRVRRTR